MSLPAAFIERVESLLRRPRRVVLGLAGPPGAGKSTVGQWLLESFRGRAQLLPMDGFHLAQAELERLGRAQRKGAPDTFDSEGYVALLGRVRAQCAGEVIYAPEFRREIEEPIAGAIGLRYETPLVITEGNYLLVDDGPWARVRALLDEAWYIDVDDALRRRRLVARHMRFGRTKEEAEAWVESTDEPNARLIARGRSRADAVLAV
ncbi:nucleoside/nucleotide kinase family protein [Piscinibacter terrae]|uniref:Nucleoside/nucleotide kinase family protein n=1 Tax=Piscinibacter terrae TaxID=2496871 RepID=A0A3N7HTL6_9BURK|nr:nucleoside/nucleotide kinase family protein [Albitalea terrae]RQP25594.1 nucleoside/nucleotide kinase family protein [Albitalea terrae]